MHSDCFNIGPSESYEEFWGAHSDLNDQNLFHSTFDVPPGVPGMSKNPEDQIKFHSAEIEETVKKTKVIKETLFSEYF